MVVQSNSSTLIYRYFKMFSKNIVVVVDFEVLPIYTTIDTNGPAMWLDGVEIRTKSRIYVPICRERKRKRECELK